MEAISSSDCDDSIQRSEMAQHYSSPHRPTSNDGRSELSPSSVLPAAGATSFSVKTTLRLAFASLLVGTLVIGGFALAQIRSIGSSTRLIYDQGYAAGTAAEEARGYVLRASRAQRSLLTASDTKERDELGVEINADLRAINGQLITLQLLSSDASGRFQARCRPND